jgi:hypothetical protein
MRRGAIGVSVILIIGAVAVWTIAASPENSSSPKRATSAIEKRAVHLERRLTEKAGHERLALQAMHAWFSAANARFMTLDFSTKPIEVPGAVVADYQAGIGAWNRYLRLTDGMAARSDAEAAGSAFFSLVEIGSRVPSEAQANAAGASRALRIACRHGGNLFNLSNLATYSYFSGEFAAGDEAARKAAASVVGGDGIEPAAVIAQLDEYKERAEKFVARVRGGRETLEETGEDELDYVIKGYGAPAGLNGYEPGTAPKPGEVR